MLGKRGKARKIHGDNVSFLAFPCLKSAVMAGKQGLFYTNTVISGSPGFPGFRFDQQNPRFP